MASPLTSAAPSSRAKTLATEVFPEPTRQEKDYITCSDAISDLPSLSEGIGEEEAEYISGSTTMYQKMMRKKTKKLCNHTATRHTEMVKSIIALVPEGGNYKNLPPGIGENRKFNEAWTRYHSKKPSKTIDTGHRNHEHCYLMDQQGYHRQDPVYLHGSKNNPLPWRPWSHG